MTTLACDRTHAPLAWKQLTRWRDSHSVIKTPGRDMSYVDWCRRECTLIAPVWHSVEVRTKGRMSSVWGIPAIEVAA